MFWKMIAAEGPSFGGCSAKGALPRVSHPRERRGSTGRLLRGIREVLLSLVQAGKKDAPEGSSTAEERVRAEIPASETKEERAERYLRDYGNSILRLAYSYLHNEADAEDILQETLIRVLDKAPSFEGPAHEKAYLLSAAANLAKNRIDYNTVREADELKDDLEEEHREDLSFVWQAVKELPTQYREVIHLFYEEGYRTKEIAEILGRKEATVRSDLKRARERLKAVLREEYDFE